MSAASALPVSRISGRQWGWDIRTKQDNSSGLSICSNRMKYNPSRSSISTLVPSARIIWSLCFSKWTTLFLSVSFETAKIDRCDLPRWFTPSKAIGCFVLTPSFLPLIHARIFPLFLERPVPATPPIGLLCTCRSCIKNSSFTKSQLLPESTTPSISLIKSSVLCDFREDLL